RRLLAVSDAGDNPRNDGRAPRGRSCAGGSGARGRAGRTRSKGETMTKRMEIRLDKRGISCVAELLEEDAPQTCDIVWNALPLEGDVYHAKYASNEIYCLLPPIRGDAPGLENPT